MCLVTKTHNLYKHALQHLYHWFLNLFMLHPPEKLFASTMIPTNPQYKNKITFNFIFKLYECIIFLLYRAKTTQSDEDSSNE